MEVCPIRKVGAPEEKMSEIGMMNVSTEASGSRTDVGTTRTLSSSPSGLPVLLNNDGSVVD